MIKSKINHKQKEEIRKKAKETIRDIEQVKECEASHQRLYHEKAEGYIQTINKGIEEYGIKRKENAEHRKEIMNSFQESVLTGDVSATMELLEKLRK